MKRALVTGAGGQDGSLLIELLLEKGYDVVGTTHGDPRADMANLAGVRDRVEVIHADLLVPETLRAAVATAEPDELYHLAAPSYVPASWTDPSDTFAAIAGGTAVLLEAAASSSRPVRVLVASSSEIYGDCEESPQNEGSPMRPRTPYGVAKLAALHLVHIWRAQRGLHVSAAITFNHESERRPERFLPRKVTRAVAAIARGDLATLSLGDLEARRDWSAARDIVRGEWLMLQQEQPADYVLASGESRTVAQLAATAFAAAGVDPDGRLESDARFVRRPEATVALGDPTRARERLGWTPATSFEELIAGMVRADLEASDLEA